MSKGPNEEENQVSPDWTPAALLVEEMSVSSLMLQRSTEEALTWWKPPRAQALSNAHEPAGATGLHPDLRVFNESKCELLAEGKAEEHHVTMSAHFWRLKPIHENPN